MTLRGPHYPAIMRRRWYERAWPSSRCYQQEQAVWQRRFWGHKIRDEEYFVRHVDDIYDNLVSHGLVKAPAEWPYPSFYRFVEHGLYCQNWGKSEGILAIKAW